MNPPPLWLIQLVAVVRKELAQIAADPRLIRMLIAAPIIQLLVFGAAVNFEIDQVPTAIVDQDQTVPQPRPVDALLADGTLMRAMATSDAERRARRDGPGRRGGGGDPAPTASTRDRMRKLPTPIQVVVDGTDAWPLRGRRVGRGAVFPPGRGRAAGGSPSSRGSCRTRPSTPSRTWSPGSRRWSS